MPKWCDFLKSNTKNIEEILLYPHQVEAVLSLQEYFNSQAPNANNISLVVLPTGCGKTGVAVLASYALNASRVLVITPSVIISRQIDEAYEKFLIDRGLASRQQDPRYFVPSKCAIMRTSEIRNGMHSRDDSQCTQDWGAV